ncbi:MAG: AAA family ATPase, partial [Myxococcales bacterium]|nr:AAA family ATPase [Myxococcales bacterium]
MPRLPAWRTPFIGRAEPGAAFDRALATGARILTLTGVGGVGKTRLAAHLAEGRPGAVFCPLDGAPEAGAVCTAVLRALRVPTGLHPAAQPAAAVAAELSARGACWLVLDNAEQVAGPLAELLVDWVRAAPRAVFVITSRWALRAPGEAVVPVAPLSTAEAVALFRAVSPAARLPAEADAAVVRLVERLDRLPLAIELAAARLEVLSIATLEARLSERFAVLRDPSRLGERHGTLWDTLDWTWGLLADVERVALAQLAVFARGCPMSGAEAVLRLPGDALALDAVHGLVRKAMLQVDDDGRLWFLDVVQAYARARLAESDAAPVEARHADWCLSTCLPLAADGQFLGRQEAMETLSAEHANLRLVLDRALAVEPPTEASARNAVKAACCLGALIHHHLAAGEALAALDAARQCAERAGLRDAPLLGHLDYLRGRTLRYLGRMAEADAALSEALALARRLGDTELEARALNGQAELDDLRGAVPQAAAAAAQALALHTKHGNARWQAISRIQLALASASFGDVPSARDHLEHALPLLRAAREEYFLAMALGHLGTLDLEEGRIAAARQHFEGSLAIHQRVGNRRSQAVAAAYLALVHHHEGALEAAAAGYAQAIARFEAVGDPRFAAVYRYYGMVLALERGAEGQGIAGLDAVADALAVVGERRYHGLSRAV